MYAGLHLDVAGPKTSLLDLKDRLAKDFRKSLDTLGRGNSVHDVQRGSRLNSLHVVDSLPHLNEDRQDLFPPHENKMLDKWKREFECEHRQDIKRRVRVDGSRQSVQP